MAGRGWAKTNYRPDWLYHEGHEEELAKAGLDRVNRELVAEGKRRKPVTVKEYRQYAAKKLKKKRSKRKKK
jgi:hypothetical protein